MIKIAIQQVPETTNIQFECDAKFYRPTADEILIPFTGSDIRITAVVP